MFGSFGIKNRAEILQTQDQRKIDNMRTIKCQYLGDKRKTGASEVNTKGRLLIIKSSLNSSEGIVKIITVREGKKERERKDLWIK